MKTKMTILAVAISLAPAFASAEVKGDTTYSKVIKVGPAEHDHGSSSGIGSPGVGLINIANGITVPVSTLVGTDAITRFGKETLEDQSEDVQDSHGGMGNWAIGKVAGAEVYFGVWNGIAHSISNSVRTEAFYVGQDATTKANLASLNGKTIKYNVIGIAQGETATNSNTFKAELTTVIHANGGGLSGTFTNGNGSVVDSFSSNSVGFNAEAKLYGFTNQYGEVSGQLYGAQAEVMAGFVDYSMAYDDAIDNEDFSNKQKEDNFAFGGTGVIQNP